MAGALKIRRTSVVTDELVLSDKTASVNETSKLGVMAGFHTVGYHD